MASRRQAGQEQLYSAQHQEQEYYQLHPAQASQFSLHTPTDPNPPNSSFRSPMMDEQERHASGARQPRLPRVFDGDESPVEENFSEHSEVHEQQQLSRLGGQEQFPLEYSVPEGAVYSHQPQGHEQQYQIPQHQYQSQERYQDHEQQYQGHQQQQQYQGQEQYQQHQSQPQTQDLQYQQSISSPSSPPPPPLPLPLPTDYLLHYKQGYDAHVQTQTQTQTQAQAQAQTQYSTAPLPSPGFPPSQFEPRRTSQQYGPTPQYVSPPHSPSFPPPQRSATFRPPHLSFPPPPRSPSFSPHPQSPSYPPLPHSPGYPPRTPHTPGFTPHTPTFPPPPTSEAYQPSVPIQPAVVMSTPLAPTTEASPPPTGSEGVELAANTPPMEPITAAPYVPGVGMEGPKTPHYTPGGANGANHAPGQIGHPNLQHGKDEHLHRLCDCFGDVPTCCMGCWCPCILYSRTNHRLKTTPTSNLNGFHHCNSHCVGFCVLAPVSWVFTFLQRGRIRDKYQLEGTLMSDCGKAYCCVMCTLVQDEREVRDREDERRRNAGPGSGVVGEEGYRRQASMIYG